MNEIWENWICLQCHGVWKCRIAKKCYRCETSEVVPFDPVTHCTLIIGSSNSWINVWSRWKDEVNASESSKRLYEEGCCGSSSHINAYFEELKAA